MDPARATNSSDTTAAQPVTRAAKMFAAQLAHQRIAPEDAVSTVTLLTRGEPSSWGEGFLTIEAVRMVVAKTLHEAAAWVAHQTDAELLLLAAHEIAPDEVLEPPSSSYPRRTAHGDLVWACCESTIGPLCNHKMPPPEDMALLAEKSDDAGRWVRRDAESGNVYESIPPSHMEGFVRRGPSARFRRITVASDTVIVDTTTEAPMTTYGSRTEFTYRWEDVADQDYRGRSPALPRDVPPDR